MHVLVHDIPAGLHAQMWSRGQMQRSDQDEVGLAVQDAISQALVEKKAAGILGCLREPGIDTAGTGHPRYAS